MGGLDRGSDGSLCGLEGLYALLEKVWDQEQLEQLSYEVSLAEISGLLYDWPF